MKPQEAQLYFALDTESRRWLKFLLMDGRDLSI